MNSYKISLAIPFNHISVLCFHWNLLSQHTSGCMVCLS
jgi:hypothetical protein